LNKIISFLTKDNIGWPYINTLHERKVRLTLRIRL